MYTNLDDHPELFRMADLVVLPVRHTLTIEERLEKGDQIAALNTDIEHNEAAKKQTAAEYKNKIDTLKAEAKLYSGYLNNGFMNIDVACEMLLDFEKKKRVYFDKQSGDFIKQDDFHPSDFNKRQTELDLDEKMRLEDIERQNQIEENNRAGMYAEGQAPGLDALDGVILDKKLGKKEKPTPKDNLHPNHGRDAEEPELPGDDIFAPIK